MALRFNGTTIAGVGFEVYQNTPNPWENNTVIGFNLPEAAAATLTIYDETGRQLYSRKGEFAKGYNAFTLNRAQVNASRYVVLQSRNRQ
ncbi:MAG: T9SS type A sorting domain-containing protein [Lewinellaceae bacterium]|nr:T9SS type A sorting domain-containing protein [Lewinellaceae bacterium]